MTPSPLRAAVLGHPIGHSKSPLLHRAAYGYLGFDCSYDRIDVPEEDAAAFAASLRETDPAGPRWAGLSVTMPLKAALLPAMDALTSTAEDLQVLNTVTFDYTDGGVVLTGHNTDVTGIVNALRHAGAQGNPHVVILGAGGTACAAVAAAARLEAASVSVCARRFTAGPDGVPPVAGVGRRTGTEVRLRPWEEAAAACAGADVVISTLPLTVPMPWRTSWPRRRTERRAPAPSCWMLPMTRGRAGLPACGRHRAGSLFPDWKCCCTRRWNRCVCLPAGRSVKRIPSQT